MKSFQVDLFVIGGGSGGVRAARVAAGHGARVAIAERANFGGTCINRGCMPKKLLVYASRFPDQFCAGRAYGWASGEAVFDWNALISRKDVEVARLERLYRTGLEQAGISIHTDSARILDSHTVELVRNGERVSAQNILIATGGHPVRPEILGSELTITSDEAFHLKDLPKRVLIVGGGHVAVEFAGIFSGLGSEVTQLIRSDRLLNGFDKDLVAWLTEHQVRRGIKLLSGQSLERVERISSGLRARTCDGTAIEADVVMLAVGRAPNTKELGLANAGVKLDKGGAIEVDMQGRTNAASVYAIGDVTNRLNLTPVAIREGQAFADRLFGGLDVPNLDYEMVPSAVFSSPEVGTVGLPEDAAHKRYPELRVLKTRFRAMTQVFADLPDQVFIKILIDGATDKVVGAHLFGEGASEMIQLLAIALTANARWSDFRQTVALHPTIAEEIVTLRSEKVPETSDMAQAELRIPVREDRCESGARP